MREVLGAERKMKSSSDLQEKKKGTIWFRFETSESIQDRTTMSQPLNCIHLHVMRAEWLGEFIRNVRIEKKLLEQCLT